MQVERNHELVGQVSLDQLEARVGGIPEEEPLSNLERHNNDGEVVKTEEFVTDCNEVPRVTQAQILADNNIREKMTPRIKEVFDFILDLQYENTKPNTNVQEEHEQAGIVLLPDAARGQAIENIVEQNVGEGNNTDIQFEDCDGPEKERQTNENQTQAKLKDSEDSRNTFRPQKEEAAEGSSTTCGKIAEKAQAYKLRIEALQHRTLNIEAKVEDDMLRHIPPLDEDGTKKADQDRTVKTEQNMETEVVDNVPNENLLLDEEDAIRSPKNHVITEANSASAQTNHNIKAEGSFTVERHLLTLTPNRGQLKISHKEVLGVSFTNRKEEQVRNHKTSEKVTDPYGDMPVLENEYLKEEMHPLGCSEEEDQNDRREQKQDKEDETTTGDDANRCTDQEREEGDGIKAAENPHVPNGKTPD